MTTATKVPVTRDLDGDLLSADDAWTTLRRHGLGTLVRESVARFRAGDGTTNARALAFQGVLALVPFLIAVIGLAASIDAERESELVARSVLALSPGQGSDQVLEQVVSPESAQSAGEVALVIGLVTAIVSLTVALAQVERGANRIYGIDADRPSVSKYGRAAVLALTVGVFGGLGFVLLVAGGTIGDVASDVYGWGDGWQDALWDGLRWPVGALMSIAAVTVAFRFAPYRHQPGMSWLAVGAGVAVALSLVASAGLALYVRLSDAFGDVYGPLTGIFALLLWSYLTALGLFLGLALAAQLEALRSRRPEPVEPAL